MVISYSTCQKEEQDCILVKNLICAVLPQFQLRRNFRNFAYLIQIPRYSKLTKKMAFCNSGVSVVGETIGMM